MQSRAKPQKKCLGYLLVQENAKRRMKNRGGADTKCTIERIIKSGIRFALIDTIDYRIANNENQ